MTNNQRKTDVELFWDALQKSTNVQKRDWHSLDVNEQYQFIEGLNMIFSVLFSPLQGGN